MSVWLSAALGLWLVLRADSIGERVSIAIYAVCITAMFGVSAAYHRMSWDERRGALMNRADHSTIFLAIAGSYTPLATHYLSGWQRVLLVLAIKDFNLLQPATLVFLVVQKILEQWVLL